MTTALGRAKNAAFRVYEAVEESIQRLQDKAAHRSAAPINVSKAYLRGRECSCPRTLPEHAVHSQGLREGCDVVVDFGANMEHPQRRQIPVPRLATIGASLGRGDSVHVKSDLLGPFVEHVLGGVSEPIVLVTGDADSAVVSSFRHLLDDPRIGHWFAQNCDLADSHPRLTRVPIGLDNPRYTAFDKRIGFAAAMAFGRLPLDRTVSRNPIGDQWLLQRTRARFRRSLAQKPLRVLCTFHQNSLFLPYADKIPARREAIDALRGHPETFFPGRRLKQEDCWAAHEDFAFVASPAGKGLDCFRTWESLLLDTIPIVKTSPLDTLYLSEGFPVVIVSSWSEVTSDSLARWRDERVPLFGAPLRERLMNAHWLERIRGVQSRIRQTA